MLTPAKVVQALEMAQQCQARNYKNCDMVVTGSARAVINRDLIIALAARHKLPAIYFERYFVGAGGLISYGPDFIDQFRQAALIASLKVKNLPIFRCKRRTSTSLSSISRPPKHWGLQCRRPCSIAPTR